MAEGAGRPFRVEREGRWWWGGGGRGVVANSAAPLNSTRGGVRVWSECTRETNAVVPPPCALSGASARNRARVHNRTGVHAVRCAIEPRVRARAVQCAQMHPTH